jgi:PAS domain S-box-containing protein
MIENMSTPGQVLSAILKCTDDGLIVFNTHEIILRMNPVAETLTGWSQELAVGRKLSDVLTLVEEERQTVLHVWDFLKKRARTGPLTELKILLVASDGQSFPIRARISFIRGARQEIQEGVIVFRNISELHSAFQQAQLQARRAEILLGIISRLNSQLDLDNVLALLLKETTLVFGADASAVVLLEENEKTYRVFATYSVNDRLNKYKGLPFDIKSIQRDSKPGTLPGIWVIPDISQNPRLSFDDFAREENVRALIAADLKQQDILLGCLVVMYFDELREYSLDEQNFLRGLADQASMAITNGRMFEKVRASRARSQNISKRLVEVQEAERRSMARELHDEIGQVLTGLQFSLESCKHLTGSKLQEQIVELQETASGLIKQVRDLSLRLMPSMLDDMGLVPTLLWYFDRYTHQTNIQVKFTHFGLESRFPTEIETTAYRIIQESLTNVARYAQVEAVTVRLIYDEDRVLTVQVVDQGKGFDLLKTQVNKAFGLAGMRERAFLVGGQLIVKSSPGKGTEIMAVLPIEGRLERRKDERKNIGGG